MQNWEFVHPLVFCFLKYLTLPPHFYQEWAIREAKAREEVREAGGEIEFGKYYSTPSYEEDEEDKIPKMAEAAEE